MCEDWEDEEDGPHGHQQVQHVEMAVVDLETEFLGTGCMVIEKEILSCREQKGI